MRELKINSNEAGQRFDKYLKKLFVNAPNSFVYKMLRKKNITLNGKKADGTEKLVHGDAVRLFLSDETFEKFSGKTNKLQTYRELQTLGNLPVIYEDEDILVVNKPSGMLSQKAERTDISANEHILGYLIQTGQLTEEMMQTFKPSVCNRLDRNTSGLLVAGKTLKGLQEISKAFKERTIQKYYRCIVKGEVHESSYLKGWLKKEEQSNKVKIYQELSLCADADTFLPIETEYIPLQVKHGYSELEVHLITGRSHQIRAHLAAIGHPIIGDSKYGDRKVNEYFSKALQIHSQMLHAYRMVLKDGREVIAPCGAEFERILNYLDM